MRKLLVILLLSLQSQMAFPQDHVSISGQIIDAETKEPLPFATVHLKNTSQGVSANEDGAFDFIVTEGETIVVSTLGYSPKSFDIHYVQRSNLRIFELTSQPVILEEVVISGEKKQLSGEAILKLAVKNQKQNFPSGNYALSVFFRETNQVNDEYIKLVEAAATIHGKKYPNTSKKVLIDEIRTASDLNLSTPITTEVDYNPFREFQSLIGKIGIRRACKKCDYKIEDYLSSGENLIAIISSQVINTDFPRVFRYYIDLENYAVIKMEFETKIPFGEGFPTSYANHESSLVYLKRTFDYQPYEGKYYLNRYHQKVTHEYRALEGIYKNYQTTHNFHVITNNIKIETLPVADETGLMNYKDKISEASKSYNAEFWKTYNILKQTPLDKKIISDLSKGKSIENLFIEKD